MVLCCYITCELLANYELHGGGARDLDFLNLLKYRDRGVLGTGINFPTIARGQLLQGSKVKSPVSQISIYQSS